MAFTIDYDDGKRYMVIDDEGMAHFWLRRESGEDKLIGHSPVRAMVQKLERQSELLGAYLSFEGDVETALHKVHNDRLEDALETLNERKQDIKFKEEYS